jgi:hypothetical protein
VRGTSAQSGRKGKTWARHEQRLQAWKETLWKFWDGQTLEGWNHGTQTKKSARHFCRANEGEVSVRSKSNDMAGIHAANDARFSPGSGESELPPAASVAKLGLAANETENHGQSNGGEWSAIGDQLIEPTAAIFKPRDNHANDLMSFRSGGWLESARATSPGIGAAIEDSLVRKAEQMGHPWWSCTFSAGN